MYIVYNVYVAHWGIQDCGEQRRLKKLLVERTLKYKHYILCVSTAIVQYHYILPYKLGGWVKLASHKRSLTYHHQFSMVGMHLMPCSCMCPTWVSEVDFLLILFFLLASVVYTCVSM